MKLRSFCRAAAMCLALAAFLATAVSQTPANANEPTADIQTLDEKQLDAADWKKVGFDTPQKTAQTFMWALREREFNTIRQCFHNPEKMGDPRLDEDSLDTARVAAKGFQVLAIKRIDETTVDLKFKVQGWGDTALVHRVKKTKSGWKLDGDSSTHDADW